MVAKSYQNLEIVKEPYMANGRMYVQVKLGNGNTKSVRWYTDKEYAKYYPDEKIDHSKDPFFKTQKEVLGFKNGYITIFKGDTYGCKDWFKENGARYTKFWGWGFSSEMEVPADLPAGIEAMRLEWAQVGEGDSLKNDDLIKTAVDAMMYEPSSSEFQGEIGQRLEVEVEVVKAIALDGYYGPSNCYTMRDYENNCYVWITSSTRTSLKENMVYRIRGTVKKHSTYKNTKQTVLTRCVCVGK